MVTCHSHINSVQLAGVASTGLSDFKTQANATLSCMFQCFHFFFFFTSSAFFLFLLLSLLGTLGGRHGAYPHFAGLRNEAKGGTINCRYSTEDES